MQISSTASLVERTGIDAEVVVVPGHRPGSLVVRVGESVFVGDLLRGSVFGSDAEVHFSMCDVDANARDAQALLARWPDVSTWFVGHFGPLTRAAVQAKFRPWPLLHGLGHNRRRSFFPMGRHIGVATLNDGIVSGASLRSSVFGTWPARAACRRHVRCSARAPLRARAPRL